MTREEAIKAVGLELVEEAEKENCEFTYRLNGYDEFMAVSGENENGERVAVYYYQPIELTKGCEDLGSLDWKIDHYKIF